MDDRQDPRDLDVAFGPVGADPDVRHRDRDRDRDGDRERDGDRRGNSDSRRSRWINRRLAIALAFATVVIAGLAVVRYVEHRQPPGYRLITRAVEVYTAAWNAHDRNAIMAAMSPGANFAASESLQHPLLTAYSGPELDRLFASMFQAGVRLETTGDLIVAGSDRSHASVTQRYHYSTRGLNVVEDGISLYTFAEVNDELKITQHMWWRPRGTNTPSMRWVIEDFSP